MNHLPVGENTGAEKIMPNVITTVFSAKRDENGNRTEIGIGAEDFGRDNKTNIQYLLGARQRTPIHNYERGTTINMVNGVGMKWLNFEFVSHYCNDTSWLRVRSTLTGNANLPFEEYVSKNSKLTTIFGEYELYKMEHIICRWQSKTTKGSAELTWKLIKMTEDKKALDYIEYLKSL